VRPPQLGNFAFQLGQPGRIIGGSARTHALIDLLGLDPTTDRVGRNAQLRTDTGASSPPVRWILLGIHYETDRPLAKLIRIFLRWSHDAHPFKESTPSIKPGAVHSPWGAGVRCFGVAHPPETLELDNANRITKGVGGFFIQLAHAGNKAANGRLFLGYACGRFKPIKRGRMIFYRDVLGPSHNVFPVLESGVSKWEVKAQHR
ncbi:hypothetical protein AAGW05_17850, partial [Arthrobacter sp. LAPM80]